MIDLRAQRVLVAGSGAGEVLVLEQPLSLWGGLNPTTGCITDVRHPQVGACLAGRVVAMERGRGSSSSSSILLEAVRQRMAPAAILLLETDGILALGAAVAREMYQRHPPVLVLDGEAWPQLRTGRPAEVTVDGIVRLEAPTRHR